MRSWIDVSFNCDDIPYDLNETKSNEDKSKQKICSSDKLSRIVYTLKFRVNKMDKVMPKFKGKECDHLKTLPPNLKEKHMDPILIKKVEFF